jgi:hypothetical protein
VFHFILVTLECSFLRGTDHVSHTQNSNLRLGYRETRINTVHMKKHIHIPNCGTHHHYGL